LGKVYILLKFTKHDGLKVSKIIDWTSQASILMRKNSMNILIFLNFLNYYDSMNSLNF